MFYCVCTKIHNSTTTLSRHNISVVQVLEVQEGSISLLPTILNNLIIWNSKRDSSAKNRKVLFCFNCFGLKWLGVNCLAFLGSNSTQTSIFGVKYQRDPTTRDIHLNLLYSWGCPSWWGPLTTLILNSFWVHFSAQTMCQKRISHHFQTNSPFKLFRIKKMSRRKDHKFNEITA